MQHLSLNQNGKKTFVSALFTPVPVFHQFSEKKNYIQIKFLSEEPKKLQYIGLFSGQHKI